MDIDSYLSLFYAFLIYNISYEHASAMKHELLYIIRQTLLLTRTWGHQRSKSYIAKIWGKYSIYNT